MVTQRLSIAVAVLTIITCGVWVSAQSTAPERGIPFRGVLELNGTAIDGNVELELALSTDAAGQAVLWTSERTVEVSAGAFSVVLGAENALPQSVFDANSLYVSVGVITSPGTTVPIGTQQVFAAFQAITALDSSTAISSDYAARASNLLIERDGATSRIAFQASVNDPGEIVHHEVNNTGNLWLSSSDDWDSGADNDAIIFGEQASDTRRHVFSANGTASHGSTLSVGGNLNVTGTINRLSYSEVFTVEQRNNGGNGTQTIGTATNRFCFLTRVEMEDIEGGGEFARCALDIVGGNWRFRATLGSTSDADVVCQARCFSF